MVNDIPLWGCLCHNTAHPVYCIISSRGKISFFNALLWRTLRKEREKMMMIESLSVVYFLKFKCNLLFSGFLYLLQIKHKKLFWYFIIMSLIRKGKPLWTQCLFPIAKWLQRLLFLINVIGHQLDARGLVVNSVFYEKHKLWKWNLPCHSMWLFIN